MAVITLVAPVGKLDTLHRLQITFTWLGWGRMGGGRAKELRLRSRAVGLLDSALRRRCSTTFSPTAALLSSNRPAFRLPPCVCFRVRAAASNLRSSNARVARSMRSGSEGTPAFFFSATRPPLEEQMMPNATQTDTTDPFSTPSSEPCTQPVFSVL